MNSLKIGDEVSNIQNTVGGVVYKIEGDLIHFVDENFIRFKMRNNGLVKSDYISYFDRIDILERVGVKIR